MLYHVFPSLKRRRISMKSFIISQFSYYPLISMWHIVRGATIKLITFTKEHRASFTKTSRLHNRNLQPLALEIFKLKVGNSPIIIKEVFNKYNLRSATDLSRSILHIALYGTESITNLVTKIWQLVSQNIKEANYLSGFNCKVKKWILKKLPMLQFLVRFLWLLDGHQALKDQRLCW